jgi:hypothetical protein
MISAKGTVIMFEDMSQISKSTMFGLSTAFLKTF